MSNKLEQSEKAKEKGNQAFQKADYSTALKFYNVAIQLNPQNHVLYSNRSVTHLHLGEPGKALEDAENGIKLKSDWPKLHLRKVEALYAQKHYEKIIEVEKEIISLDSALFTQILNNTKEQIKLNEYYKDKNCTTDKVSVQYLHQYKGKALIANTHFSKSDEIFRELPLLLVQKLENKKKVLACSHCLKFIGLRVKEGSTECNPKASVSPLVTCEHCNREIYCSSECKNNAWSHYHELLCYDDENHPLAKLDEIANRTSHRFLLVARILASIIINFKEWHFQKYGNREFSGETFQEYFNLKVDIFNQFCKSNWINMSQYDDHSKSFEHEEYAIQGLNLKQVKKEVISETLKQIRASKPLYHQIYQPIFRIEFYSELIGLIDMNASDLEALPVKDDRMLLCKVLNCTEDEVPFAEGTGLFILQSCINHSCRPNAQVIGGLVDQPNAMISLVALRNIKPGEEITISYINNPQSKPAKERLKELQGCYLFNCTCTLCKDES